MPFVRIPDIREHIVERDAERDDHEDVCEEGKWDEVFELPNLARND